MRKFTEFVRRLADREDILASEFDACLTELGRALRNRLQRLGMFNLPPAYFGYPEYASWDQALDVRNGPTDPLLDCFDYAITRRLDKLAGKLRAGTMPNVDGLVLLNVGHFLFERQRDNDPVGHAVFENLEAALLALAQVGTVTLENLDGKKIRNGTVIGRAPGSGSLSSAEQVAAALAAEPEFEPLYVHLSHANTRAQTVLAELLPRLGQAGVGRCRFQDLVDALKERVHQACGNRNRPPSNEVLPTTAQQEESVELIRIVLPDDRYADNEQYEQLVQRVRAGIETLPQKRTRNGVARLLEEILRHRDVDEEVPTIDELSRRLGAPTSTIHDHWRKLRQLFDQARTQP
jgi:hypothetical protein